MYLPKAQFHRPRTEMHHPLYEMTRNGDREGRAYSGHELNGIRSQEGVIVERNCDERWLRNGSLQGRNELTSIINWDEVWIRADRNVPVEVPPGFASTEIHNDQCRMIRRAIRDVRIPSSPEVEPDVVNRRVSVHDRAGEGVRCEVRSVHVESN